MDIKEIEIIHTLLIDEMGFESSQLLKNQFHTTEDYFNFLNEILLYIINNSDSKKMPAEYFNEVFKKVKYDGKLFISREKIEHVIEGLAELAFEGHAGNNISYLKANNELFNHHLNFLKELNKAIAIVEYYDPKKKDNKSEIRYDDLYFANSDWSSKESQWLKENLNEWDKEAKIIRFDFRQALKYAAIFIIFLGGAYLIYDNYKVDPQLADNFKKVKPTIAPEKPIDTKPLNELLDLKPACEINFNIEVIQEQNFGFSGSEQPSIKISIIDVTTQLNNVRYLLEKEIQGKTTGSYGPRTKHLKYINDSLINLQGSYRFELSKKQLTIYSDPKLIQFKKDRLRVFLFKNKYYLHIKKDYFFLNEKKEFSKLKKVTDENVLDELSLFN